MKMDNRIRKNIEKMIISLTKLIEATTANFQIETEINQLRLDEWKSCGEDNDIQCSCEDDASWPDDFEEDWG
jgi:hypothetical protein|tara:strand:+ start:2399 stop:2614 length:216 start_codon:yes stop_codon:yes gene_type:complete